MTAPFDVISMPHAEVRYELRGIPGPALDLLVARSVGAGLHVEPIEAGARYRLNGDRGLMAALADEVAKVEGYSMAIETPDPNDLNLSNTGAAPRAGYARTTYVQGSHTSAVGLVVRAIDAGLSVGPAGHFRYAVTGPTATQMQVLAEAQGVTLDEVLALWHLTPQQVAAEDAATALPVHLTVSMAGARKAAP